MIDNPQNLTQPRRKTVLAFIGMLVLASLLLYFGYRYRLTRSLVIPAWSVPAAFQANGEDWVKVDLVAPAAGSEIPVDTGKVVLRVRYSLRSTPTATLLLQLRSRLDIDGVDRGSDLSNLLATHEMTVQRGRGEETVELTIAPGTLMRFPPGSQLLPIAALQDSSYPSLSPNQAYFHRAYEELALKVPDTSQLCAFDAERESLAVTAVMAPAQFSEATPKAQVIVQYDLLPAHAQLMTLVAGYVHPTSDGEFADFDGWEAQTGSWQYQDLETAEGTAVLDLHAWFPAERPRQIIDENNQVTLALGLVCGRDSYYSSPELVYSQVFPEYLFTFSAALRNSAPTRVPPADTNESPFDS